MVRGDRLVTFGSQGDTPYVPGVPVGSVRQVLGTPGSQTRTATIATYAASPPIPSTLSPTVLSWPNSTATRLVPATG